jgi:hypothetical protein
MSWADCCRCCCSPTMLLSVALLLRVQIIGGLVRPGLTADRRPLWRLTAAAAAAAFLILHYCVYPIHRKSCYRCYISSIAAAFADHWWAGASRSDGGQASTVEAGTHGAGLDDSGSG